MTTTNNGGVPVIPTAAGAQLTIPPAFERLYDLAYNMWWSWQPRARELWQRLKPQSWARRPNPLSVLPTMDPTDWEALEVNDSFVQLYHDVIADFDAYLEDDQTWYERNHPGSLPNGLAYLCTEFGVHHTLPLYSGGLGVLAGDHAKAASDLGIPMVGVGLLYRRGYFRQAIDPNGRQLELYLPFETARRPLRRVLDRTGHPLTVQVELPGRRVDVAAWRVDVGRVPLLLLDTDLPSNEVADRPITHILYVRGREMRLCQELVLGIGGVRVLEAIGMEPSTWHINEGHAAFSLLERLSNRLESGDTQDAAVKGIRESTVFTLHTPVPAGNEVFDNALVKSYLSGRLPGIDDEMLDRLGDSGRGVFDLGAVAIRLSSSTNGVSARHGEVVTHDWQHIIGGPGAAVTNGVHMPTWIGGEITKRLETVLGRNWTARTLDPDSWEKVRDIDDESLWEAHTSQKERLMRRLRWRVRDQWARHGAAPGDLRRIANLLPADRLTIVFARRSATYKRAGLLLSDPGRLQWLLTNPAKPIQILFAGKAHPADVEGKHLIRRIIEMGKTSQLEGHLMYIEDYDMEIARYLVGGADVWLNTPRPPMEASGTSGMKAAANGVLNLSILDGWWCEGFNGDNGWGFGEHHHSDEADAGVLYDLLEHQVAPRFYDRDERGVPTEWVEAMKEAIISAAAPFSADRMVAEYAEGFYLRANNGGE